MRCGEIMKREIESVRPDDTIQSAAQKMRDANIGFLPVCDASGKAVGTLTDRDIALRVAAEDRSPSQCRVGDIMTREVIACRPEDDVRTAERLMGQHHKSRLICIDERGIVCGVLSLSDVAEHDSLRAAGKTMREVTEREVHTPRH